MTQESIVLSTTPPFPGADAVAAINKANQAIATGFAGPDDPAALAGPYMTWRNSGDGNTYIRNDANTGWFLLGPTFTRKLAEYAAVDKPTTDRGFDIWITGVGGHKWNGTAYVKTNYDTTNIIGTVVDSSGVPAGAIIERGSNANGKYTKWADGTQICTALLTAVNAINNAEGSVFVTPDTLWTFPSAFASVPAVAGAGSSAVGGVWLAAGNSEITAASAPIKLVRSTSSASAPVFAVTATGRWV